MKKALRTLRNYICFCGIEKEEFKAVKKDAYISNFEVWKKLNFVMVIAFAILFSISKALAGNSALSVMDILVWPLVEIFGSLLLGALLGFLISLGFKFFKSRANRSILIICAVWNYTS